MKYTIDIKEDTLNYINDIMKHFDYKYLDTIFEIALSIMFMNLRYQLYYINEDFMMKDIVFPSEIDLINKLSYLEFPDTHP